MPTPTYPGVPSHILSQVETALQGIRDWNALVMQARGMERLAAAPGRYEYDLRYTSAGNTARTGRQQALKTLALFEKEAARKAIAHAEVYALFGGKPALLDEGPSVNAWHPRRSTA